MIKLFKVKDKQREISANADGNPPVIKQTAAELRVTRDMNELTLPATCTLSFPKGKDDLMNFEVVLCPDEGFFEGVKIVFSFQIPSIYPHEPPKVKCKTRIYHPNIDYDGNICLNILREDWKPVLNLSTVIFGLYHLFTEPNLSDPLNPEAAEMIRNNPEQFREHAKVAMTY